MTAPLLENASKMTVMLVDDHAVVRAGFRMLLATESDIDVIAEAARGEELLSCYSQYQPDIVVMDLSMTGIGGLETTRRLHLREDKAKVIIFSVHHEKVYVQRALEAGVRGYVCKHAHPACLIDAIRVVAKGDIYLDPSLREISGTQIETRNYQRIIDTFSPREFDVFVLLAKGMTAHQIADTLCLSYKTIANYATTIRRKLNVNSMVQLAQIASLLNIF